MKLRKELDETKLHIRLADMLRKTVGVSQLERESFNMKVMKKKDKINALKNQVAHEINERERISERVEYLEK